MTYEELLPEYELSSLQRRKVTSLGFLFDVTRGRLDCETIMAKI